jgi:hypothetical protein
LRLFLRQNQRPRHRQACGCLEIRRCSGVLGVPGMVGPNPESQIVTFPLNRGKDVFIFATTAQESWHLEAWTTQGSVQELRDSYAEFHPDARASQRL